MKPGDLDDRPGRPDAVSAAVTARVTGKAVEDLSARTEAMRVFANPDGTWSSESSTEPEQVQDGDPGADGTGGWHLIDATLQKSGSTYAPAHTVVSDLKFTGGGTDWFASMAKDGHQLRFGLDGLEADTASGKPVEFKEPTVAGDTAIYPDAIVDGTTRVDLVVRASGTGFEHWWVINKDAAVSPATPVADLDLGLTVTDVTAETNAKVDPVRVVKTTQGGLRIVAGAADKEREIVVGPAPLMWDASTPGPDEFDPAAKALAVHGAKAPVREIGPGGEPVDDGKVHVRQAKVVTAPSGTSSRIGLTVPAEMIQTAASGAGPVTVDPSFTVAPNADTWLEYPNYTSGQTSSEELRVGTYDGGGHTARTFMKFNDGDSVWKGKHILSADLVLRNWYSGSCTGAAIRVGRVIEDWTLSGLTWANQPNVGSLKYADLGTAYGYDSTCPAGDATWNLTAMVQDWADGFANKGIRIKAVDETSSYTWRRYRSANYTTNTNLRPKLVVSYNSYPGTTSTPVVSPGVAPYATSLTPKVCFTVTDTDPGAKLRGNLEVYSGSSISGTAIWSWTESTTNAVATGTSVCPTIPTGKLANGSTYTVRSRAYDGTDYSKSWSASKTFTVDTTKPSTTISATGFTNSTWTTDPPASNTFTFTGSADTKSFSVVKDTAAPITLTANTSGVATMPWLPTSGAHTVKATPTDKAGNVGSAVTFSFGVGPASLLAPNSDERSTGVFAIKASGPPNATGAQVTWRRSGASTWETMTGVKTTTGGAWSGTVTQELGASITPSLVWDAAVQPVTAGSETLLTAPAHLELRTCFTYSGTPSQVCSIVRPVQLVPSAFGGNFPTTNVGPANVALVTGEATITEPDAVDATAGVGRTFATLDGSTLTNGAVGAFGPGWSATLFAEGDTGAKIVDHRSLDRTLVLVPPGGSTQMFTPLDPAAEVVTPTAKVEFKPAGVDDGARLVLNPTVSPSTLTLTRPQAATTSWTWDAATSEWKLVNSNGMTGIQSFAFDARYPTWIGQSTPGATATCTEQVQEPGCRGLKLTYTGSGADKRVIKIDRITVNPDATTATQVLATYTYTGGLLSKVCGPDPDGAGALTELCSSYAYDTATVSSRTLLKTATPPGQKPWNFHYDTAGRLTSVTREQDADTVGVGTATWTISYDLAPTRAGLPDMTTSAISAWGQEVTPVKAFAVFGPDQVPANRQNPTAAELEYAQLWYTDTSGATTNTGIHANVDAVSQWLVDTTWYDEEGNTVRTLDGAGRATALAASQVVADQQTAALAASTITDYNTAGTRVEAEYGPVHTATLKNGTTGDYRAATVYDYDEEEPTLGGGSKPDYTTETTSFDMVVQTRHYATDPDLTGTYDEQVTRTEYAPLVTGDGNGWDTGVATKTLVKLADGTWRDIAIDRYDTTGRRIETRQPGGATTASGAGSDAHATVFSYYTRNNSDPDCTITGHADRGEWDGLACKTGPAAQPAGETLPITYNADYNAGRQPTKVIETSAGVTRTTTVAYDTLGRTTSAQVAVTGTGATNETLNTTISYNPVTGLPASTSDGANTITATTDTWGRDWTSTDATGLQAVTTYTTTGAIATLNDGRQRYVYTYNQAAGEHRGLASSIDLDLPTGTSDVLTMKHDARGAITEVGYPNNMTAAYTHNQIGVPTGLTYTTTVAGAPTELAGFTATTDPDGRVLGYTSRASTQAFGYDSLGRLTKVEDNRDTTGCTTRTYGFTPASERTSLISYEPAADDPNTCQATTPAVTKTSTYDTANRITNTGYTYDPLGRTLTVPAADTNSGAGAGPLQVTYHANDMVKSMTQQLQITAADGTTTTRTDGRDYTLDPAGRIMTITSTESGIEKTRTRYEYPGTTGDSPSYISTTTDNGQTWATQRNIAVAELGMIASVSGNATNWHLANLHGDLVATINGPAETGIASYTETDEYGAPTSTGQDTGRYGYLGTYLRSSGGDSLGAVTLMGARLYNPVTGLFLSNDSVLSGNENRYNYPVDPVNKMDVTGGYSTWVRKWTRWYSNGKLVKYQRWEGYSLVTKYTFYVNRRGTNKILLALSLAAIWIVMKDHPYAKVASAILWSIVVYIAYKYNECLYPAVWVKKEWAGIVAAGVYFYGTRC